MQTTSTCCRSHAGGRLDLGSQVDAVSRRRFKAPYKLSPQQQVDILATSPERAHAQERLDWFFRDDERRAIRAYYTSEIGIHKELE